MTAVIEDVATKFHDTRAMYRELGQIARRLHIRRTGRRKDATHNKQRPDFDKLEVPAAYVDYTDEQLAALDAEVEQLGAETARLSRLLRQSQKETIAAKQAAIAAEKYSDLDDEQLQLLAWQMQNDIKTMQEQRTVLQVEIARRAAVLRLKARFEELTDIDKQRLAQMLVADGIKVPVNVPGPADLAGGSR